MIYLTGDTHGQFRRISDFCYANGLGPEDVVVILGDAGINYEGPGSWHDQQAKERLEGLGPTFLCIHGNHEMRPATIPAYAEGRWRGGVVYVETAYPEILFAKDGEIYDLDGTLAIAIGGAYSVDKDIRIANGLKWFADEQPDDGVKARVEARLDSVGWKVDAVLSHTCPLKYVPTWAFIDGVDQSTVDVSTEEWLDTIEQRLDYGRWYCGHYHVEDVVDGVKIMYEDWAALGWGAEVFEHLAELEASAPDRRSFSEVACDLCINEKCLDAFFKGQTVAVRRSDGASVPCEHDVSAFVTRWLRPENPHDMKYIVCDGCGRWFHRDRLGFVADGEPDPAGYIAGGMYCEECRAGMDG